MKVLIFGASGLLGKALMREWQGDTLVGLTSRDADIRNSDLVKQVVQQHRPDWIVLSAAYTDVDGCESNQDLAFSVNCDGAANVAKAAKACDAKLLFLSSDYVFDGTKNSPYEAGDRRNPQSVYGRTKADAEERLLNILPDCCIARTSWLFGVGGKCFPDTILKLAATKPTLDVVSDQRGSPTYVIDLARAIAELCRRDARGIVHVTNSGECTWFDFARAIVACAGFTTEIRPTTSAQMARPAPRPAYSVLSPKSLHAWKVDMPDWRDALARYFAERSSVLA